MTAQEQWRVVPEYPDYLVSDTGRVVSRRRGESRELAGFIVDGYRRVQLTSDGRKQSLAVHRLVAAAFIGPCPEGMEVRHLDGERTHNRLENLCYGTRAENMQDRLAHGRNPMANKTHCKWGHEFTDENTWMNGSSRWCRTCHRRRQHDYRIRRMFAAANVPTERAA